ncbi:MAG: hypothetical protein J2P57_17375, partial [Acidimicrobiaceae bacterium]|nr:hypothetical protein [Acidimicrobiaceae bacterium]
APTAGSAPEGFDAGEAPVPVPSRTGDDADGASGPNGAGTDGNGAEGGGGYGDAVETPLTRSPVPPRGNRPPPRPRKKGRRR